jgi:hypothetical protein
MKGTKITIRFLDWLFVVTFGVVRGDVLLLLHLCAVEVLVLRRGAARRRPQ